MNNKVKKNSKNMVASKRTIGKLGMYIPKPNSINHDINPDYIVVPQPKKKLSKEQKKHRAYNIKFY